MTKRALFNAIAWYVKRTPPHAGRGVLARLAYRLDPHELVHEMSPGVKVHIRIDRDEDRIYWTNRYEPNDEVRVFASLLRPGMVVVDVGANIGMYALFAARAVGPAGRVFAFEPVPHIFERLTENIRISGADNVSAIPIALSDAAGVAPFFLGRNDSMGSLCRAQTAAKVEVSTDTLGGFLQRHNVERVDAVKIDAEGAEMRILVGMRGLLARSDRPILLVEHNDDALRAAGSSAGELFKTIVGFGYSPHVVEAGRLRRVGALTSPYRGGDEDYANYVFLPGVAGR